MAVFDPLDWFRLAQKLVSDQSDEASLRNAVGRAYYTCHLVARDQLYGIDGRTLTSVEKKRLTGNRRAGEHEVVPAAISQNRHLNPGRAKRIVDQLGELKAMRVQADYFRDPTHQGIIDMFQKYAVPDWLGLAQNALTFASNLLPELQKLSP